MGLFSRKKRTASVGIALGNDLGSFSGLEVAVDNNGKDRNPIQEETKKNEKTKRQETVPKQEKRIRKTNVWIKSFGKLDCNRRRRAVEEEHCPLVHSHEEEDNDNGNGNHHEIGNSYTHSSDSNDLSVYTSGVATAAAAVDGHVHPTGFVVTLDHLSDLILDLETAVTVGAKRPIRALKMLLALSSAKESSSSFSSPSVASTKSIHEVRIEMIHSENGRLVPVLLHFLNRCMVQSKEHILALLVLGNLSIPQENKAAIAIQCQGAEILARLLCEDPSSQLVALVLVNLTYDSASDSTDTDATAAIEVTVGDTATISSSSSNNSSNIDSTEENKIRVISPNRASFQVGSWAKSSLNKRLLATNETTALVESLAFALRVSTLTRDEYEDRRDTIEDCNFVGGDEYLSPATRLSILMAKDQQLRSMQAHENEEEALAIHNHWQHRPILPATASPEQILRQLRSNEQELEHWGSIDGTLVVADGSGRFVPSPNFDTRTSRNVNTQLHHHHPPPMVETCQQIYPETAKWCLSALRNLTKPCNGDATAAHVMIKSGIFSLVVQCITTLGKNSSSSSTQTNTRRNSRSIPNDGTFVRMGALQLELPPSPPTNIGIRNPTGPVTMPRHHHPQAQFDDNFLSASFGKQLVGGPPSDVGAVANGSNDDDDDKLASKMRDCSSRTNSPYSWEANSIQDAALSIVLNLAASSKSREYMNEPHIVKVLTIIAEYPRFVGKKKHKNHPTIRENERETMNFQALKARMALSYLIGSQGHFGQTKLRSSASTVQANRADSSLVMSDSDVELLVELLANSLNHRGKGGNGGGNYLSGTFDLKCVIFSLRCLLTHTSNQEKIARLYGLELNALLMNSLARFSLEPSTIRPMDSESSGHVVFSLYLLSNHCFVHVPFLPEMYGAPQQQPKASMKEKDHGLAANILVSYLRLSNIPPEGRHAAQQLLLRLNYLNFENCTAVADFGTSRRGKVQKVVRSADLKINYILLAKIKRVKIANRKHGSKPDPDIFHRPVLRCQKPCNWDEDHRSQLSGSNTEKNYEPKIQWTNPSAVSMFANALIAVQQLSYGSIKTKRSSSASIDDVAIANSIARCASHEDAFGSHNFLWAWEDAKRKENSSGELSPLVGSNRNAWCETDSRSSRDVFSLLQLCCSKDSAETMISEI